MPPAEDTQSTNASAPTVSNYYVTPQIGFNNTTFTYYATYTDLDNDTPTKMQVEIDFARYDMNFISGTAKTGMTYNYTKKLGEGLHYFKIVYGDGGEWNASFEIKTDIEWWPFVKNSTNPVNMTLTNGFVTPTTGYTYETNFTYYVKYTNINSTNPDKLVVFIDNVSYNMSYHSGSIRSGAYYKYITNLSVGHHSYSFYCEVGNENLSLPVKGYYNGPYVNTKPKVYNYNVSPQIGWTNTNFNFMATYQDLDYDSPTVMQLEIDGSKTYPMFYLTGSPSTGSYYNYSLQLTAGLHYFRIIYNDGNLKGSNYKTDIVWWPYVKDLSDPKNSTLSEGTVTPNSGYYTRNFTYSVKFVNVNNNSPTKIQVYINNVSHAMSYVSGSNRTGAIYEYKTTLDNGTHNYYFYAEAEGESIRSPKTGYFTGPLVSDSPIVINYYVTPKIGYSNQTFTYYATYINYENKTPEFMYIQIDGGGYRSMYHESGIPLTGMLYRYSSSLSVGLHNFRFYYTDYYWNTSSAYFTDFVYWPFVKDPSDPKNFSLDNGYVTPQYGFNTSTFTYYVDYVNINDTPPTSLVVYIDNVSYAMSYVSGSNRTGGRHQYQTTLNPGSHRFHFYCSVGSQNVTYPQTTYIYEPYVYGPGLVLRHGSVNPTSSDSARTFYYNVFFMNSNNTPPDSYKIYIDGYPYNMTYGSGNWLTGVGFQYYQYLGTGYHYYHFEFKYDNKTVRWPAQGYASGPDVNVTTPTNYTKLSNGYVSPMYGTTKTTFTYNVTYSNTYNYPPSLIQVKIDNTYCSMKYVSGSNQTGALYQYQTMLSNATHKYSFYTYAYGEQVYLPSSGQYTGPYVNFTGLKLSNCKVTPTLGWLNTKFNYTLIFANSNGTAPSSALVYIDGNSHTMSHIPANYSNGVTFWYGTNLSAGQHYFYFEFKSSGGTVRWPAQGSIANPWVNTTVGYTAVGTLTPTQGNISTQFTYKLNYSSPHSGYPLRDVQVVIDDASYNMTLKSGDNYSSAVYEYTTTLGIGDHNYYFTAKLMSYTIRIPGTGNDTGPKVIDEKPRLSAGMVSPIVGFANNTVFEFSVIYKDFEDKAPGRAKVFVNGSFHDMTFVSGSNKTGAKYNYKSTFPAGNYQFHFNFSDGKSDVRFPLTGNLNGPVVSKPGGPINYPPVLWNGSVSPLQSTNASIFVYTVYYKDNNSDAPNLAQVWIDGNPYNMSAGTGNYLTGVRYEYKTYLTVGSHYYHFVFTDANNSGARLPAYGYYTGPTVTVIPNKPPELTNGTVSPSSGNTSTYFTYRIHYKDAEGNIPTTKLVYIDNVSYTMTVKTYYPNHKLGAIYEYTTQLSTSPHNYYFVFNDSKNLVRYPTAGYLYGPKVTIIPQTNNSAPVLHYGAVSPSKGSPSTTFTYSVYYYDRDNDAPTMRYVVIDGKFYVMNRTSYYNTSSTEYYALYSYSTKLPVGTHAYYFLFSDGKAQARLPTTGNYTGPVVSTVPVNLPPKLYAGKVTPTTGNTSTEFVYTVLYYDPEGAAPTKALVYIDGTPYNMKYIGGGYSTNATYEYRTKLGLGTHSYHFLFSDGNNTARAPRTGSYYGPVVIKPNHAPQADAGPDQKYTVGPPKTVYFDGSDSSDPDGDNLTFFWDFGDGGYAYGEKVDHVFRGVGTYNVKLKVYDGWLTDEDNCSITIIDSGQGKTKGKAPSKSAKINTNFIFTALGALIGASAMVAGAAVVSTEWGLYGLFVLFLPLYVRIKGKKILDNFTRGKIYGYIIANPGDHYSSIKSSLKLKNGALAYHLKTLEREKMIKAQTDGKYKRFYPYEMEVPRKATQLTTMRRNIVDKIIMEPGITQSEISEQMGVSHQAISYHLRTLVQLGAVSVEKKGRANHCYPGENGHALVLENEENEWN